MATVVLTNWTIYYADDAGAGAGMKQIKWTGSTGTNTVRELYSEVMNVFDNASNNDAADSIPLKAVTPTLYEIGSFDAGDEQPWFIDPISIQHLSGAGLNTVRWTYVSGSEAGIFRIPLSSLGTVVEGDVGAGVTTSAGSMTGTLLHVDTVNTQIYIRPTSSSATHDWSSISSGTITCNGHTCTQNAAGATGENIYANIYSLGTLASNTDIYVIQNEVKITQWWDPGHIDILVLVSQEGTLIDNGNLNIFARQYTMLYDNFENDVSAGGRNPVALSTTDDINNDTGYLQFLTGAETGGGWTTADEGTVIQKVGDTTRKAVITSLTGTGPNYTVQYYLIGASLTDFSASDQVENLAATKTMTLTAAAPTNVGPNATNPATITQTFGGAQYDLGNGFGNAWYSVAINCQGELLSVVYERLKYITRRGETSDIATDANHVIIGEQYHGVGELYIPYDTGSQDNPFNEGETITGPGGFMATLTSKHDRGSSEGFIVVRYYSGTIPTDGDTLTGVTSTHTAVVDENAGLDPVVQITQNKQAPFGSFAGGRFFGARGVYIHNMNASDANNYQLTDSEGNIQVPPSTVSTVITVQALSDASVISGASVLVWATDNANYFYKASVSITGSGTTATVTHTSHGLTTGDNVMIEGVTNDDDYNGAYQVTVTDPNTYTYTTTETLGSSPATGTPTSTFVFIVGTTNGAGVVSDTRTLSADQPISGWVRKSSSSPYYRQGVISGTVSYQSGFSVTVQLASDE